MACKISGKRNLHWCFTSTPYLGFGLLIHFFLVVFGPENQAFLVVSGKFLLAIVFEKAKRATVKIAEDFEDFVFSSDELSD